MDLPKGFVEDDKRIYGEVANLSQLPLEVIQTFWRVYTITNRQLYDPTARRLENFWWHVWGSDRRYLKAEVIAAMWQHISYGPTFVPLKGSPNRYEPPVVDSRSNSQHELDLHSGNLKLLPHIPEPPSQSQNQHTLRELSASSTRPPPPHPILKKPRVNSKSGPRPTARFVSPPDSDAESDAKPNGTGAGKVKELKSAAAEEVSSSGSTGSSDLEMASAQSTTANTAERLPKKKMGAAKKFVASGPTSKRRPHLSRRLSSQSSVGSEQGSKAGSSAGSRYSGSHQGSLNSNSDRGLAPATPDSYSNKTPPLSAKALGKRPAVRRPSLSPSRIEDRGTRQPEPEPLGASPAPRKVDFSPPQDQPFDDAPEKKQSNGAPSENCRSLPDNHVIKVSSSVPKEPPPSRAAPLMERASSNTEYSRPRQQSFGRTSSYGLLSNATSMTSNVAATGHLSKITDEPDINALAAFGALSLDQQSSPARGSLVRNESSASLMMPTVPSSVPSVPMARSRSQLTLLLEREKERIGDKRRPALNPRSRS